jgi:wyosine [tRNA(Phe)-imidazoG37] synthetase (radical SAM superfamily)
MNYRYIYGPIPSRRLGRSLGISPIPDKMCNYSCIYCMLGRTDHLTTKREEYFKLEDILAELDDALEHVSPPPDHISIVGNGEPTLYARLRDLIRGARGLTSIPIAVITNGALLSEPPVREALAEADVVLTSFNAPTEELFRRIDRPCPGITFEAMKQGLLDFAHMRRKGQLWVEMMLLEGINDSPETLEQTRWVLQATKPDRVFVDTPIRPPAEDFARPVAPEALKRAERALGGAQPSGFDFGAFTIAAGTDPLETLAGICKRHPMRDDQAIELLVNSGIDPLPVLDALRADPRFLVERYAGQTFFLVRETHGSSGR